MPRALRILGDDITYHVVANCNAKEFLFKKHSDFTNFMKHIIFCQKTFYFELHAYCILHSHIHLIITTKKGVFLDKVMYEICQRFAVKYNKSHQRTGHFWKNRYFSKVIDDDLYALVCLRYIHRNPVRHGLVKLPTDWYWSCVNHYLTHDFGNAMTPLSSYIGMGNNEKNRCDLYRRWLETPYLTNDIETKIIHSKAKVLSSRFQRTLRLQVKPILSSIRDKM